MVISRYTQWDGTQKLRLDADKVFEKLAEYLSYTDDVRQAMDWMMRQGMDFDGVKVMGLEEFLEQLRQEMRQRYRDFNLKNVALRDGASGSRISSTASARSWTQLKGKQPGVEEKQRAIARMPRRLSRRRCASSKATSSRTRRRRPISTNCSTSTKISATSKISAIATATCSTAPRASNYRAGARADARDGADANSSNRI